jgi:glycosyltransferase involved in cell wall biosynthesis
MWHVLDVGSIWMKEFASALAEFVSAVNWSPVIGKVGALENWEREEEHAEPFLRIRHFPVQRGYSRFPISLLENLGQRQTKRMLRLTADGDESPLICTTPFYAPVAERWPGPVIYYQTDLTYAYHGVSSKQVLGLDTRLCQAATAVCPNSNRIGHYMVEKAGCDPGKIVIIPNATRKENLLPIVPAGPAALPQDLADLPRPVMGVIGNLAANLDWCLLREAIERTPDYSWAFVGPYSMQVHDEPHRRAREQLLARRGRIRFTGPKSYGLLQDYARALDVAILPYRRKEPTFSGSSTRFYEHLAACRPMLSTRGFEELLHKEPLLQLVDDATGLVAGLAELRDRNFRDGCENARWQASRQGTWTVRAATLIQAAQARWPQPMTTSKLPAEAEGLAEKSRLDGDFNSEFRLITPN